MRPLCFSFVIFAAISVSSQVLVEHTYLLRAETTSLDPYTGMTHVCVLVYPNGKYRLEKIFQSLQGGSPESRVYLDQLPDASLKQLQAALEDADFNAMKTPERHGGIIRNMETLMITIPREHTVQNLSFETAAQRKPFEKTMKPLLNWMKETQKRKTSEAKGESSNNCAPPRVVYRTMLPSETSPKPDQQ
jgi:hypothetical protein